MIVCTVHCKRIHQTTKTAQFINLTFDTKAQNAQLLI